jgi:hypothetical protein
VYRSKILDLSKICESLTAAAAYRYHKNNEHREIITRVLVSVAPQATAMAAAGGRLAPGVPAAVPAPAQPAAAAASDGGGKRRRVVKCKRCGGEGHYQKKCTRPLAGEGEGGECHLHRAVRPCR